MRPSDYFRIKPGKPLEGIVYFHVDVVDPRDDTAHSIRACQDKAEAMAIKDRLVRIAEQISRDAGRKR